MFDCVKQKTVTGTLLLELPMCDFWELVDT